jgi:hypothetical protein
MFRLIVIFERLSTLFDDQRSTLSIGFADKDVSRPYHAKKKSIPSVVSALTIVPNLTYLIAVGRRSFKPRLNPFTDLTHSFTCTPVIKFVHKSTFIQFPSVQPTLRRIALLKDREEMEMEKRERGGSNGQSADFIDNV